MKKIPDYTPERGIKQILRIMRLSLFLFLFGLTTIIASPGYSQGEKISMHLQDVSIREVFQSIQEQSEYLFFFNDQFLDLKTLVTVEASDTPISDVLNDLLEATNLTYKLLEGNLIVITPRQDEILLKGTVTDSEGTSLPGVSVFIQGTDVGTTTDINGNFQLKCSSICKNFVVSYVGMKTIDVPIDGRDHYNIVLEEDLKYIDEVLIIGYGTTTRRLATSAISSIKADVFEKQSVTNPIHALQGRVSGLSITQSSGAIGSGIDIQIRGINSIQSGTQPLIIVDGAIMPSQGLVADPRDSRSTIPVGSYMWGSFGTNPFNTLNPDDVESIEILKDADATAIYGSRGANGVILITTKKASAGESKFTVDFTTGVNMPAYVMPRMNLDQYLEMRQDAFDMGFYNPTTGVAINPVTPTEANAPDLLLWSQTESTDWAAYEYGNPANSYKLNSTLSGGTRNISYLISGGFSRQEDITPGSPYQERFSGRANLNHFSADNKLRINLNASYAMDILRPSQGGATSSAQGGQIQKLPPNMPLYNEDGSIFWPGPSITQNSLLMNPIAVTSVNLESATSSLISNLDFSYELLKGLELKAQFGFNSQQNNFSQSIPSTSINPNTTDVRNSSFSQNSFQTLNFEPQITYSTELGKGNLDILAGGTLFGRTSKSIGIYLEGFSSDVVLDSWAASNAVTSKSSTKYYYRFLSVFGRLNYNWENKYLINLTYRRDGSSRFGPDNKFGNFGAVGLAWLFSNESFIENNLSFLSYGKLRFSYGSTGNDNIADYRFTSLYTATDIWYNGATGLASTYLSDPTIGWETSNKLDFGLEQGYFDDRILLTVNKFRTHTINLLLSESVSSVAGFNSFLKNMPGLVENKGWEFELSTRNFRTGKKLQWRTSFNLTLLENSLLEYPDLENSSQSNRLEIGKPLPSRNTFLRYIERNFIFEGINAETGMPVYTDLDENGIYNSSDYQYIGSTIPRKFGGLSNTISFKGFELDVLFQFSQQLTTNHHFLATYAGQLSNPTADWYGNYWKQPGDVSKYPRLYPGTGGTSSVNNQLTSYYGWSSAGTDDLLYVRLKSLQLSYTLPSSILSKAKLAKAVFFVRGQNIGTWTSKEIFKDPESVFPASVILKSWTAGIQITL